MNYVTQSRSPNPGALTGALVIPLGVGAMLAFGLAFTHVVNVPEDTFTGFNVTPDVPPPPPKPQPKAETSTKQSTTSDTTPTAPDSEFRYDRDEGLATKPEVSSNDDISLTPGGELPGDGLGLIDLGQVTLYDPIPASPKGNPGDWITNGDYRSTWISRELSGTARFTVEINTRGRVTECAVTGSTGHSVLDTATCRLLTKRARFNPARDGNGEAVAGSYSSSVTWEIPE